MWFLAHSALTKGDVLDTVVPLLVIAAREHAKKATQDKVFWEVSRWIEWNCSVLMSGKGAERGFYGEEFKCGSSQARIAGVPLAGGWTATFAGTTGDYKARHEWNGTEHYYQKTRLCETCGARQPTTEANALWTYGDFRHRAAWTCTMTTIPPGSSPLQQIPGWNIEMSHRDIDHTIYLGFGRDICSSAIISMLTLSLLGEGSPDEQLGRLHAEFDTWCHHHGLKRPAGKRLSLRTLGRADTSKAYPLLSTSWKAMATKVLIMFMAFKTERVCRIGDFQKLIATCSWGLADFVNCLDEGGITLGPNEIARALNSGRVCLLSLQALCVCAHQQDLWLWRLRPKCHYFDHILRTLEVSNLNPKLFGTLRCEDMLGKLKRIGKACDRRTASMRILQRWLLLQSVRLQKWGC